jgi:hypothetical protein
MTFDLSEPIKHQERELAHPLRKQALDALLESAEKRRTDAHRLESLARELPILSQAAEEGLWLLVTRNLALHQKDIP